MKILLLTPHLPEPPLQGTALRNGALTRYLSQRHSVDLLTFLAPGEELAADNRLHAWCGRVAALPQPQRPTATRLRDTLLSPLPDMALRLASPEMDARLGAWLRDGAYDIVQAEGIEMAPWLLQAARAAEPATHLVFDDHNCEYLLQKRNALADLRRPSRLPAAAYSLVQWAKLRRYERRVCLAAHATVAVSQADADALRALDGAIQPHLITNGIDPEEYAFRAPSAGPERVLLFTGKMDYRPNIDAVLWFADEVLPLLLETAPELRLRVVGRNPHARLEPLRANPAVEIVGAVEDIRPSLRSAGLAVLPLRVGGGTRFKALEAMACGLPIVSTTLGVEGLGVEQGRELLLADTPAEMAAAILWLLEPANGDLRAHLTRNARALVERTFAWPPIVAQLEGLYDALAAPSAAGRTR